MPLVSASPHQDPPAVEPIARSSIGRTECTANAKLGPSPRPFSRELRRGNISGARRERGISRAASWPVGKPARQKASMGSRHASIRGRQSRRQTRVRSAQRSCEPAGPKSQTRRLGFSGLALRELISRWQAPVAPPASAQRRQIPASLSPYLATRGSTDTGHEAFFTDELAASEQFWKICGWHLNQQGMQVGDTPGSWRNRADVRQRERTSRPRCALDEPRDQQYGVLRLGCYAERHRRIRHTWSRPLAVEAADRLPRSPPVPTKRAVGASVRAVRGEVSDGFLVVRHSLPPVRFSLPRWRAMCRSGPRRSSVTPFAPSAARNSTGISIQTKASEDVEMRAVRDP